MPAQAQSAPAQPNTGHPRRWTILAVLVLSLLVVVLDNTVLNVALRTIADPVHGLGATQAELEWSINSYTLVFAGLLFTAGVLGDRIGRRRMLVIGLVLFGLASLASAYAQTPTAADLGTGADGHRRRGGHAVDAVDHLECLRSARAGQGDRRVGRRGRPRRGHRPGRRWRAAGDVLVGLGLPDQRADHRGSAWCSCSTLVPESRNPNPGRIDLSGVLLSIAGLVALVYGIIDGGEHGFDRISVWVCHPRRTGHPWLVHPARAAQRPPIAGREPVQGPAVLGRGRLDRPGLLRGVRDVVLPRLLPPAGPRLLAAAGRLADDPVRCGAADLRAAERRHGPPVRAEGGLRGRARPGHRGSRRLRVRRCRARRSGC